MGLLSIHTLLKCLYVVTGSCILWKRAFPFQMNKFSFTKHITTNAKCGLSFSLFFFHEKQKQAHVKELIRKCFQD